MELKYTAIILSKKDVGEADRIYTFYTKEAGKIQALAESVRKPQAKLAGHLENFVLTDISMVRKRGLGKITGSVVENNFTDIRNNLDALNIVFETLKVFDRLVGFEEKDPRIFELLKEYLEAIDNAKQKEKSELLSQGFFFQLLNILGYKIETSQCVSCREKIAEGENFFSAEEGGVVCALCARKSGKAVKISDNVIKIIRIFSASGIKSLVKLKVGDKELKNLKLISGEFIRWING
jgi:DNA repair protein RecO (recombination protein O)